MKDIQEDTPPSSINGDEISSMDDEVIYFEDMEEIQLDDEEMDGIDFQDEDDTIIEKPEDLSIMVFQKHDSSVFCCDLHPSGKLAVTGGEDDKAFVWSVETGQSVLECVGHKDSLIFVGFSFDGAFLATVDMGGMLKVWKCNLENQEQWPVVFEFETDDLSWGLWHFGARVLICGSDKGDIYIFKIPSGETKVLQGHHRRTDCGRVFPDGVRLAAGYEDGTVKVWDIKTNSVLQQIPPTVHQSRVTDVDIHTDNNLIGSVSSNGKAVLATSNNGKVVGQIDTEIDLESVAFAPDPELGLFALGSLNGSVTIWDTARQMVRHYCAKSEDEESVGVTKIIWVKDHLVTGCLDGSVRVYDARSGDRSLTLTGHLSEILDLAYNPKENIILTTSDDGTARIFKYNLTAASN